MKCPCKGCHERTITCHGVCEKFAKWKAEKAEAQRRRQEEKEKYPGVDMTQMRKYWRNISFRKRRYVKR